VRSGRCSTTRLVSGLQQTASTGSDMACVVATEPPGGRGTVEAPTKAKTLDECTGSGVDAT
jgi:hypothetical protein